MTRPTVPHEALLRYHRQGELLRLTTVGMTNNEIRELIVGLWARLSAADREDHIRELQHYQTQHDGHLSDVASEIARGLADDNRHIDLRRARRMEWSELPGNVEGPDMSP